MPPVNTMVLASALRLSTILHPGLKPVLAYLQQSLLIVNIVAALHIFSTMWPLALSITIHLHLQGLMEESFSLLKSFYTFDLDWEWNYVTFSERSRLAKMLHRPLMEIFALPFRAFFCTFDLEEVQLTIYEYLYFFWYYESSTKKGSKPRWQ